MRMFHKYHKNPSRPSKRTKSCSEIAGCMRKVRISNPGKYDDAFQAVFGRKPKKGKVDDVMAEQEVYEAMLALDEEQLKLAQAEARKRRREAEASAPGGYLRPHLTQASKVAALSAEEDIKKSRRKIDRLEKRIARGQHKARPPAKQVKGTTKAQKGVIVDPWQTKEERKRAKELHEDWRAYIAGEQRRTKRGSTPTSAIYAVEGGAFRARIDPDGSKFRWTLYDPNNRAIDRGVESTKGNASKAVNKAKDKYLMRHGVGGQRDIIGHVMPPPPEATGKDRIYNWYIEDRKDGEYLAMGTATSKRQAERALDAKLTALGLEEGRREKGVQRAELTSRQLAKKFKRPFKPVTGYEEVRRYKFPKSVSRKAGGKGRSHYAVKYRLGMKGYYAQIVMPDGRFSEEIGPYKKIEEAEKRAKFLAGTMSGTAMRLGGHLEGNPTRIINAAKRGLSKMSKKHRISNPSIADRLGIGKTGIERGDVDEKAIFNRGRLAGLTTELDDDESDIFYMGYFYGVIDGIDLAGVQNYLKRRRIRKRAEKELFDVVRTFKVKALAGPNFMED